MLSVGVSGYMEQWVGMVSVDGMDADGKAIEGGVGQFSDAEFAIKGKLESDSGLTFSVKIEVEGNTHASQIDESQLTVAGDFGQITLGAEDGASVLTHHGVRDAGIGISCGDLGSWIKNIKGCGPDGFGTAGHGLGDKNQISYFSPRLAGVQFGATYIPNSGQEAQTSTLYNNDADAWSIGGNYVGDFGGANIAVSAGHYQGSQTMDAVKLMSGVEGGALKPLTAGELDTLNKAIAGYEGARDLMAVAPAKTVAVGKVEEGHMAAANAKNRIAMAEDMMASMADAKTVSNFGLQVGFGAFSFDVAYMTGDGGQYKVARMDVPKYDGHLWDHDSDEAAAKKAGTTPSAQVPDSTAYDDPKNNIARSVLVKDTSADFETVSVGVMYTDGPMAVSLAHSMVEADDGSEQSGTLLSLSYTLAPGVSLNTSIFGAERSGDADTGSTEGAGFVTGIKISF